MLEVLVEKSHKAIRCVTDAMLSSQVLATTAFAVGSFGLGTIRGYAQGSGNNISPETLDLTLKYGPAIVTGAAYGTASFMLTQAYEHYQKTRQATAFGISTGVISAMISGALTAVGYYAGYGISKIHGGM